jgi:hypothetical protein
MGTTKSKQANRKGQQPEALATFADAARHGGKKPGSIGLKATAATRPLSGDLKQEQKAATKILNENATGHGKGGKAAARRLPDRTRTAKN